MKEYRTKQINFRVTESEYARISERMQEAGIKHPSAYLRKGEKLCTRVIQWKLVDVHLQLM